MPRLHDCKICQVVCTCTFLRSNSEHAAFPAQKQTCITELLLSAGPLLYILTKLWDGVQARLTRGVCRLGKQGCSSAVPSLKQPSCKACNRSAGCATLHRLIPLIYSNGVHTACCCCGCSQACFHLLVHGQWDGCLSPGRAAVCLSTGCCIQPEYKACNLLHSCKAATCLFSIPNEQPIFPFLLLANRMQFAYNVTGPSPNPQTSTS